MISFDTFFTTVITLSVFYGTTLVTFIIAKNNHPTLHLKHYIITMTAICLFVTFIAFVLCFGHMPFLSDIFAVAQSILPALEGNSFSFKYFYIIYLCGVAGFLPHGVLCSFLAMYIFDNTVTVVIDIVLNILAALIIPYFVGTFIYVRLFVFSPLVTILTSLLANLLISWLLIWIYDIMVKIDKKI